LYGHDFGRDDEMAILRPVCAIARAVHRKEIRRGLGVVPLEVTDALLEEFRRLADRHQRGFLVEQVMELLTTS
jgi:hypothetical protein